MHILAGTMQRLSPNCSRNEIIITLQAVCGRLHGAATQPAAGDPCVRTCSTLCPLYHGLATHLYFLLPSPLLPFSLLCRPFLLSVFYCPTLSFLSGDFYPPKPYTEFKWEVDYGGVPVGSPCLGCMAKCKARACLCPNMSCNFEASLTIASASTN
jgi:hypothetical protein